MKHDIRGTTMQTLDLWLEAGESVYTESGGMAWLSRSAIRLFEGRCRECNQLHL